MNYENHLYLIYPDRAESGTLETLPETAGMKLYREKDFLQNTHLLSSQNKICITSEATLDSILDNLVDQESKRAIQTMKDKHLFRKLLQEDYAQFKYQEVPYEEIEQLKITGKQVLKPIKGCFGTAVKIIDAHSDMKDVVREIKKEMETNSSVFSESVLSQSQFILEDFIGGEEYAIDMFYDSQGTPHIVNIYYHPLPKNKEYLHMIYYTNKRVFDIVYEDAITFFKKLNRKLKVKNIALHSEFKLDQELIPIEINPMRFGGMGLGNMVYHSLKINPYHHFIQENSPDWKTIWEQHRDRNYVYFIA